MPCIYAKRAKATRVVGRGGKCGWRTRSGPCAAAVNALRSAHSILMVVYGAPVGAECSELVYSSVVKPEVGGGLERGVGSTLGWELVVC